MPVSMNALVRQISCNAGVCCVAAVLSTSAVQRCELVFSLYIIFPETNFGFENKIGNRS